MDNLLENVLRAHGGPENWSQVATLSADMSLGGPFWAGRGWPEVYAHETVEIDAHHEHVVFTPFPTANRRSVFDGDLERVVIETVSGETVEERAEPRASFPRFDLTTPWDAIQVAYFTSYAVWNYLTTPFLFTYPGVETREIEPWQEDGQTWRRLRVHFSNTIVTHNPEQIFYYDTDFMLRRLDYQPEVTWASNAHYASEPRTFDGFVFPTRRQVFRRRPDGMADQSLAVITLTIDSVTTKRR